MYNDLPKGDLWILIDNDINSQHYREKFKFNFSYIESKNIKNIVKTYIWRNYKEGNNTLSFLYNVCIAYFKKINEFFKINNISNLNQLTNKDIDKLLSYLNVLINSKNNKPYSQSMRRNCLKSIKSIIRWGQIYMPNEVPKTEIFTGNEYIGVNKNLKINFIPDDILEKINKALKDEKNHYIKYGIIILQSTGMRIGDMLKLTIDCVKPHLISGYTLTWYDHKNRKEREPMPISNECAIAVEKLIEYTKELREQADDSIKNFLFIHNPSTVKIKEIRFITISSYNNWINSFTKSNNIKNINDEIYNLTAHQFRRTLATDMLSKGTDLKAIQEVLGHTSAVATKRYYADVKDKERGEIFKNIGIIGNINKVDETVITDKKNLIWFEENKDKRARMEDGYCTKPCNDGKICDRLLRRQKCYTCSRYITTPEYLQAHKNHLVELEKQLEGNIYGDHYAEHFLPTVEILKEIVKRLEEIQYGNN